MSEKKLIISKQEIENIEFRSEEVQEILSRPPKWIIRWGISMVFIIICILIIGSIFFVYPDRITVPVSIMSKSISINSFENIKDSVKIIGEIHLSPKEAAKIKVGQQAKVKLDNYSYLHYGALAAEVNSVSYQMEEKNYLIVLYMKNGMTTLTGEVIHNPGELFGTAEIIINESSFFSRLINPFKKFFSS